MKDDEGSGRLDDDFDGSTESAAVEIAVQHTLSLIQRYSSSSSSSSSTTTPLDHPSTNINTNNKTNEEDDQNIRREAVHIAEAWKNPDAIYRELDHARTAMAHAWTGLKNHRTSAAAKSNASSSSNKEEIRAAYMDMITDAFADALDGMRRQNSDTNDDPVDVDVLVDCLQSGLDLFYMNASIQNDNTNTNTNNTSNSSFDCVEASDFVWNNNATLDEDEDDFSSSLHPDEDEAVLLTPHERRRRELGYLSPPLSTTTAVIPAPSRMT